MFNYRVMHTIMDRHFLRIDLILTYECFKFYLLINIPSISLDNYIFNNRYFFGTKLEIKKTEFFDYSQLNYKLMFVIRKIYI